MNENTLYATFWIILGTVVVSIASFTYAYWTDHNKKIVDLIGKGTDPIAIMCAMQDTYGKNPVCIILATKSRANTDE